MDEHETCNHITVDGRGGSAPPAGIGHPHLSAADLALLAERIAAIDGVTCAQALRQIREFMRVDLSASTALPAEATGEPAAGHEPQSWACAIT